MKTSENLGNGITQDSINSYFKDIDLLEAADKLSQSTSASD